MKRFMLFAMLLAIGVSFATAQPKQTLVRVNVSPDHSDWNYTCGEKPKFDVAVVTNSCPIPGVEIYYEISEERKWIPKYQLYQHFAYYGNIFVYGNDGGYGYLYNDKDITFKVIIKQCITLPEKIPFKKKDGFGETQSLLVTYSPEATTCGQILLRALFPLKVYGLEYNGVGQLSLDEYSIFFPLYNLNRFKEALEVHHTKYPQSGLPWDIDDKHLITLCHSCHMKEHN